MLRGLFSKPAEIPSSGGKEGAMISLMITVAAVITITVTIAARFKRR
jgi:hypothetical protein